MAQLKTGEIYLYLVFYQLKAGDVTSIDPFAYTWDKPINCLFSVIHIFDAQMIKADDKYYIVKDPKLNSAQPYFDKALCSKFIINQSFYVVIYD